MHDSAFRIGELVMRTYSDLPNAKILEVGSLNVNGCLRDAALPNTHYVGLDLEEGPSVDFVLTPGADFPVERDSFDLVMASSVFEHDARFWDTFLQMCSVARPGGHIYVNAPSNGTVHRYPMDCWRFYPDAGLALAEHARQNGYEIDLVESFIGNRHSDVWNDFVGIFRKGPSSDPLNTAFVYHRYPSMNARTWQSRAVYNESDRTEDMTLIETMRGQCEALSGQTAELEQTRALLAEEQGQRSALNDEVSRLSHHVAQIEEARQHDTATNMALSDELLAVKEQRTSLDEDVVRLSDLSSRAELARDELYSANLELSGQLSTIQSNLCQRQEEIEQAWARLAEMTAERDSLQATIADLELGRDALRKKVSEADSWVFNLAGDRKDLEVRLAVAVAEIDKTKKMKDAIDHQYDSLQRRVSDDDALIRLLSDALANLQNAKGDPRLSHAKSALIDRSLVEARSGKNSPILDLFDRLVTAVQSAPQTGKRADDLQGRVDLLETQKQDLHLKIEMLVEELDRCRPEIARSKDRIVALTDSLASMRVVALEHHRKSASSLEKLEECQSSYRDQARSLKELADRLDKKDSQLSWLRRLYEILEIGNYGWAKFLPRQVKQERVKRALLKSGVFDWDAYLQKYPDVAEVGMDPLRHYVLHGMAEGRVVES